MDFSKIISDSKISLIRNLITIASSFILIRVITRTVGEAEYGIWMAILAVVGFFAAIGGGHMHGALIRYGTAEKREGQAVVDTGTLLLIVGGVVTLTFLVVSVTIDILPYQDIAYNRQTGVGAVCLLLVTTILSRFTENYPRSRGDVKQYEVIKIVSEIGYLILLPSVFIITKSVLMGVIALSVLYGILTLGLLGYYYPTWLQTPNVSNFRRDLNYALPMIPKEMSSRIFAQADRYLILLFISPTAVAIYTVVDQIVMLFRMVTGIMNPTLYPSVSKAWENGEYQDLERLYNNILRGYVILGIPALAGLSILATPILSLLSTETIASQGATLVPLLGVGYLVWGVENPIAYILSASEQTEKIAGITVVTAIGNVILNIVLLPTIGLIGAVIATVTMQFLKTAYMIVTTRRVIAFSIPLLTTGKAIVATTVMSAILFLAPGGTNVFAVVLYPPLGVIIYALTIFWLVEIDINQVRSLFRGELL